MKTKYKKDYYFEDVILDKKSKKQYTISQVMPNGLIGFWKGNRYIYDKPSKYKNLGWKAKGI